MSVLVQYWFGNGIVVIGIDGSVLRLYRTNEDVWITRIIGYPFRSEGRIHRKWHSGFASTVPCRSLHRSSAEPRVVFLRLSDSRTLR